MGDFRSFLAGDGLLSLAILFRLFRIRLGCAGDDAGGGCDGSAIGAAWIREVREIPVQSFEVVPAF
jgi:hypothetical protein